MHLVEHWLEAKKAGYRLAAVTESLDDLLHAALLGERANTDSKAKSHWTRAGLRRAAAAGRYHGGRPPYGYRFEGRREERSLVSDPAQAAVVRRIYGAYRAGRGCHRVADDLNADSVQPPRAKKWDRSTIANILDSPVYIGRVPYNDEVFEGEHDPILDAELWQDVQTIRAARRESAARGEGRLPRRHLLVHGVLRCSCGAAMRPRRWKHGRELGESYVCSAHDRRGSACAMPPLPRADVDEAFVGYLGRVVFDLEETRAQIERVVTERIGEAEALFQQAEDQFSVCESGRERADRAYVEGKIPEDAYARLLAMTDEEGAAARAEVERLRLRVEELCAEASIIDAEQETLERFAALRVAVAERVSSPDSLEALRAAITATFERVAVKAEGETIVLEPIVRPTAIAGWRDWTETDEGPRARAVPRKLALSASSEGRATLPT